MWERGKNIRTYCIISLPIALYFIDVLHVTLERRCVTYLTYFHHGRKLYHEIGYINNSFSIQHRLEYLSIEIVHIYIP